MSSQGEEAKADSPAAQEAGKTDNGTAPARTEGEEEPSSAEKGAHSPQGYAGPNSNHHLKATAPADGLVPHRASAVDPNDPMSLPPHGTEVFVGGIPKNATEAQIKEFAEQAGQVHSVNLSKDPTNPEQNRGFGFVRYLTKESADTAKVKLHETQLKDTDVKLRVSSSQSKHKIYIGNIPRSWSKEQLLDELNKNVKGLETTDLVMSREVAGQNRGFAFLTFYNHECAAAGKDILSKSSFKLDGRQLNVSYAEGKSADIQAQSAPKSKSIYVGKLPQGASEDQLKEAFGRWGKVTKIVIPPATDKRPEQRFGFVHFEEQSSADEAVADAVKGQRPEVQGSVLEVKAARPQALQGDARQAGFNGAYGQGSRMPGRSFTRGGRGGSFGASPRGRGGRGPFGTGHYGGNEGWYDQGYSGYEQAYDTSGAYGGYGGMAAAAPVSTTPGMTMVPMMLPSGQVGYVLQSADLAGARAADYGSYRGVGPERGYGGHGGRRGRGRGPPRYRPY